MYSYCNCRFFDKNRKDSTTSITVKHIFMYYVATQLPDCISCIYDKNIF